MQTQYLLLTLCILPYKTTIAKHFFQKSPTFFKICYVLPQMYTKYGIFKRLSHRLYEKVDKAILMFASSYITQNSYAIIRCKYQK